MIRHWKEKAGDRQTVVFCSTVDHAAATSPPPSTPPASRPRSSTASMGDAERKATLAAYAAGEIQVIVNVAVLTEGWDHPPTSCVVLLRPSSYKSTMIQMVGRGLRTVNPEEYPGVVKTDCVVLDFGTSSLIHGSLEQDVDLDGQPGDGRRADQDLPGLRGGDPARRHGMPALRPCLRARASGEARRPGSRSAGFIMTEIDLLERSSFAWVDLFGDDAALMANGFNAWARRLLPETAAGMPSAARKDKPAALLGVGERIVCLARPTTGSTPTRPTRAPTRPRRWLRQPPTEKQLAYLPPECRHGLRPDPLPGLGAADLQFNKRAIRDLIVGAEAAAIAAAA